jgi:PAS domain S-box-containing protein
MHMKATCLSRVLALPQRPLRLGRESPVTPNDARTERVKPRGSPSRTPGIPSATLQSAQSGNAWTESAALLAGIVALATDAIISVDESHRIVLFNAGAERIFGFSCDEIMGGPLDQLIPEKYRGVHGGHLAAFKRAPVASRQMGERNSIFGRRKNGEVFPAEASISRVEIAGAQFFSVVLRDISTQVAAEAERERLLAHAERARTLAEVARAGAQEAEHRARFLADASELLDRSLQYEETLRSVARLVVPGMAAMVIVDLADENGVMRRLDVVHQDPAMQDAARRLGELPLDWSRPGVTREARQQLRSDLTVEVTPETLRGWSQSEEHLALWEELDPTSFMVVPLIARERLLGTIGLGLIGKDRRYSTEDVLHAEELARRIAISVDNARLYAAATLATQLRNQVLGIVSHDLRNPLSVIAMCGARLSSEVALAPGEAFGIGDTIQKAADWMQRLVADLLDISSIESGKLSMKTDRRDPVIIAGRSAMAFEHVAISRGIELRLVTPETASGVLADEQRIVQVLSNIIANALKFTNSGGEVSVEVVDRGRVVQFSVRDTGRGIPADQLPHIFDRFWHADAGAGVRGFGLGLSIARGIIEAHDGLLWAESELGTGSTFHFTVPVAGNPG